MKKKQQHEKAAESFFRDMDIEFLIHELKNPVAVIEASVGSLLRKPERFGSLNERQQRMLNRALRNVKKTREMLHYLLEVGRGEACCMECSQFDPVGTLFQAIYEALETMGAPFPEMNEAPGDLEAGQALYRQYGIILDIPDDVVTMRIYQDEKKCRQILSNLVKNGLHYRKARLEVAMAIRDDQLHMEINDDGPGINPEHHHLIFERYTRLNTKEEGGRSGHGLGLAGARILARSMGGDIEVISVRGKGATFCLTLPMNYAETHTEG